jgi:hypothetical protein
MNSAFRKSLLNTATLVAVFSVTALTMYTMGPTSAIADRGKGGSVAARLGGQEGIRAFLEQKVVPAVLADPELAPCFGHLTETPGDIEDCLSRLLDHDLGGGSAKNGTTTATGHVCSSSMSDVHHDMVMTDHAFSRFVEITGEQALAAGVPAADVAEVAKQLETYRGSIVRTH